MDASRCGVFAPNVLAGQSGEQGKGPIQRSYCVVVSLLLSEPRTSVRISRVD